MEPTEEISTLSANKKQIFIGRARTVIGFFAAPILASLTVGIVFTVIFGPIDGLVGGVFISFLTLGTLLFSLMFGLPVYLYLVPRKRVGLFSFVFVAAILGSLIGAVISSEFSYSDDEATTLFFVALGALWGVYFWIISLWRNKTYFVPGEQKLTNFERPIPKMGF